MNFKPKDAAKTSHYKKGDIIKRNSQAGTRSKHHINVTSKTDFKVQIKRCEEILQSEGQVILHCVGRAITKGASLGLQLVKNSGDNLIFEANTSTVEQIDELQPLCEEDDFTIQKRRNSSLHIRIYKKDFQSNLS